MILHRVFMRHVTQSVTAVLQSLIFRVFNYFSVVGFFMSVESKSPKRNLISLRRHYLMASAFVCILVILAAVMSNWHTRQVSIDNTSALQTQVYVNKMLSVVRGALWQVDISMNTMLVSPLPEHEEKITQNINLVRNEVTALAERTDKTNLELNEGIETLS